jgi:hypothetical protein
MISKGNWKHITMLLNCSCYYAMFSSGASGFYYLEVCYAQLIDPIAGSRLALAATFSTQHVFPQVHAIPVLVV